MMIKKIFLLLVTMMALSAGAQNAVGDWIIHTSFVSSDIGFIAEAEDWVYYVAGGNLFRLDKQTQENEALSPMNYLSDMSIAQAFYNSDKDYLVLIYANSNIDVIKSDGSVINMPEIKNAVMTSSKNINFVTFAPGEIYVATDFGYVVIDDVKFVIKESHVYGEPVTSVARLGQMLLVSTPSAGYYGLASQYHEQLESFTKTDFISGDSRLFPINDSTYYSLTGWTMLCTMRGSGNGNPRFTMKTLVENRTTLAQKTPGGFLLNIPNLQKCYRADATGAIVEEYDAGSELFSAHPDGNGTLWAVGPQGLHHQGEASYYLPNALTFGRPFWMAYNKSQDKLYVSSPATNYFYYDDTPTWVNTYDGMTWRDVTPEGAPQRGSFNIHFMPDDPNTYLLSTWREGLLKVTDGEIVLAYNATNSPMRREQGAMHPITSIDRNGNVWVVQSFENPECPVMVLPAAKARQNTVTTSDWITPSIDGLNSGHTKTASFISTHNSQYDIKVFTDGDYQMPLVFWNSAGDYSSRPQQVMYDRLVDQDGQPFTWLYIMCLTEDLNGLVWMGSTEGVIAFNPAQAFSTDFRINHIKVPRNDGTGMADYLLNGIQVNDIAVDGANRKWIATQTSGLFLVSPDGTEVINKFNTTNSPLTSNTVFRVCCNPNSNSVYITTPVGVYEYFSDSSPAEPDYSDIYAYPNPVRPEFTGDVTITGMMDGTLIKIADASGNVIRQLKSTGGMATWDCCDHYGQRVKTGVYMVLCSRSNGGSESVVTKIAVIR